VFDLSRRTTPFLTYYLHGDRRDRGPALVRIGRMYRLAGWQVEPESADHVAVVCEFAAVAPQPAAVVLRPLRPGVALLRESLEQVGSPYATLLGLLDDRLPALTDADRALIAEVTAHGVPTEQVGLDPHPVGGPAGDALGGAR
jgi:nitrate reductase molybdenum cofactor assembly chaperone NarJ/NarW